MVTNPLSRQDEKTGAAIDEKAPTGWQYSLRGLLVVITIVSVSLTIAVHYQGLMVTIIAIGMVQATILLASDWLIQGRNRWALALLTSIFWAIPGCGLLLMGIGAAVGTNIVADRGASAAASALVIAAGAFCYFMAIRRWRQLNGEQSSKAG